MSSIIKYRPILEDIDYTTKCRPTEWDILQFKIQTWNCSLVDSACNSETVYNLPQTHICFFYTATSYCLC